MSTGDIESLSIKSLSKQIITAGRNLRNPKWGTNDPTGRKRRRQESRLNRLVETRRKKDLQIAGLV